MYTLILRTVGHLCIM